MRRLHRMIVAGALVLPVVSGSASLATPSGTAGRQHVATPGGVTLVVRPTTVSSLQQRMTIFGSVDSGRANEEVVVQFKACGLYPLEFRDAFETTTGPGGAFSFEELRPVNRGISGVFRAVAGRAVSAPVPVQQRASVYLRVLRDGRYQATVAAALPFWRRHVVLQRYDRRLGVWATVRKLVLTEQPGGPQGPAPPFAAVVWLNTRTEPFRPRLPRGTQFRAVFPPSQAKPCYLAGVSEVRRA